MTTHHSPIESAAAENGQGVDSGQFAAVQADMVLAGRATLSAEYLRGLAIAGQVASAGAPRKLPLDLFPGFPDADPALIQEVWDRALVVGMRMERLAARPYYYRDQLERLRGELDAAGYAAMAGSVAQVLATAVPEHPADGESEGRGHDEW